MPTATAFAMTPVSSPCTAQSVAKPWSRNQPRARRSSRSARRATAPPPRLRRRARGEFLIDRDAREEHHDHADLGQHTRDQNAEPMNRREHDLFPYPRPGGLRATLRAAPIIVAAAPARKRRSLCYGYCCHAVRAASVGCGRRAKTPNARITGVADSRHDERDFRLPVRSAARPSTSGTTGAADDRGRDDPRALGRARPEAFAREREDRREHDRSCRARSRAATSPTPHRSPMPRSRAEPALRRPRTRAPCPREDPQHERPHEAPDHGPAPVE